MGGQRTAWRGLLHWRHSFPCCMPGAIGSITRAASVHGSAGGELAHRPPTVLSTLWYHGGMLRQRFGYQSQDMHGRHSSMLSRVLHVVCSALCSPPRGACPNACRGRYATVPLASNASDASNASRLGSRLQRARCSVRHCKPARSATARAARAQGATAVRRRSRVVRWRATTCASASIEAKGALDERFG